MAGPGAEHGGDSADLEGFGFELPEGDWLRCVRDSIRPAPTEGRIGDYEFLEEHGRGGQGVVFRARDPRDGRIVALKRLIAGAFATERGRQRFEREMEIAARLRHPGIVEVLGMDVVDRQPVLAMEWVDGEHLDAWAARGGDRRPPREVLRLLSEVAEAVHHAHQRGVIHRDLKPANVLVDREGRPRVLDFGVAKLVLEEEETNALTRTEEFMGSPAYAPPEQLRDGARAADVRGDVYSLGAILYEMLTGRLPRGRQRPTALLGGVELGAVARPSSVDPSLDRELDAIVLTALVDEPERRYPSVEAFAADIDRYLDGRAILALPPSTWYAARKLVSRNPLPFALTAVLLALALAFAAHAAIQNERLEEERNSALSALEFIRSDMLGAMDLLEAGRSPSLVDVLAEASAGLDERFADRPLARRDLLEVIGRARDQLGDYEGAIEDLVRAEVALGDDPARLAEVRTALATAWVHRGDYDEASRLLDLVEAAQRGMGAAQERSLARTLVVRAMILRTRHRFEELGQVVAELRSFAVVSEGRDPKLTAALAELRAATLSEVGRIAEAEQIWQARYDELVEQHGEQHASAVRVRRELALVRTHRLPPTETEAELEEILELRRRILGTAHPSVGESMVDLATLRVHSKEFESVVPMLRGAIAIFDTAGAERSRAAAQARASLAGILMEDGVDAELDEAEELLLEAEDLLRRLLGEEHVLVANVMTNRGQVYTGRGEHDRARELLLEANAMKARLLGPAHPDLAQGYNSLAVNAKVAGDLDEADAMYERAWALLSTSSVGRRLPGIILLNNFGTVRWTLGDSEGARALFGESYAIALDLGLPVTQFDRRTAARGHAYALRACALPAEAEPIYREIVDHPMFSAASETTFGLDMAGLGLAIASQGRYDEGIEWLERAELELEALGSEEGDEGAAWVREQLGAVRRATDSD